MALPDSADQFIVDCQGRAGRRGKDVGIFDPANPLQPAAVLEQWVAEQRSVDRPEKPLYGIDALERVDARSAARTSDPDDVDPNQRWIGYRPDGSIFAVVLLRLDRQGASAGWVVDQDQGCLRYLPHEIPAHLRSPSASPSFLDRSEALREPLGRECQGRYGAGAETEYGFDPRDPPPTDLALALDKWIADERAHRRPEQRFYESRFFERHDAESYPGSYPDDPGRHARFVGFRPDGTVFADVVLVRLVEHNGGWMPFTWAGCSDVGPDGRAVGSETVLP